MSKIQKPHEENYRFYHQHANSITIKLCEKVWRTNEKITKVFDRFFFVMLNDKGKLTNEKMTKVFGVRF